MKLADIKRLFKSKAKAKKEAPAKPLMSVRNVEDSLRFIIFLVLIGMGYIWNSHYAERQVREMESLKTDVKSLKSRYVMKLSNLNAGTRFSEISVHTDSIGLRGLQSPPFKLVKNKTE